MAAEKPLQEPAAFGEICVNLVEEKQFILDPQLFALAGNNVQQYCTMLSLLEYQNSKPEMFLITEEGIEAPLTLVQIVEDFEIESYQGDGAKQTVQLDPPQQESPAPVVHLQYKFTHKSEAGLLRGKLSSDIRFSELQEGTTLQKKEYEFAASGNDLDTSSDSLQARPAPREPVGGLEAANPQQEGSRQPTVSCCTTAQPNEWIVSPRSEPSIIHTGEKSGPCNKNGESSNEQVSFSVQPNAHCSIAHQLAPSGERSCRCSSHDHTSPCSTNLSGTQPILTNDWERLFSRLSLSPNHLTNAVEKLFKCPDCGKGYTHKSSISRHLQSLHRKGKPSLNSGQERSFSLGAGQCLHHKPCLEEKPLQGPDSGMSVVKSNAKNLSGHSPQRALPGNAYGLSSAPGSESASKDRPFQCSICGKTFTVKSTLSRHLFLHGAERPFKCPFCTKGYIQKCHLKRHVQKHHTVFPA